MVAVRGGPSSRDAGDASGLRLGDLRRWESCDKARGAYTDSEGNFFLAKLDAGGRLLWFRTDGDSLINRADGVATDPYVAKLKPVFGSLVATLRSHLAVHGFEGIPTFPGPPKFSLGDLDEDRYVEG